MKKNDEITTQHKKFKTKGEERREKQKKERLFVRRDMRILT